MRAGNERGMALVAVMFVMLLLLGMGAAMHTGTIAETTLRGAHARATAGFYAAEAGINRGMGDYRNIFLSYNVPSGSDFDMHSLTMGPRTVRYQLAQVPCPPPPSTCPPQVRVPAGKPFAGLNATEYRYTATAWSELTAGDSEASLGTEFDVDYIPLFQFLAFYAGDLEILPGNNMTLTGAVHTNGSLYLNSTDGKTLIIQDNPPTIPAVHMSAAGDVIRRRKDDTSVCTGAVQIARLVDEIAATPPDLKTMPCAGVQSSSQLSGWLGAIRSHQPVVSVPAPDSIARGSGTFWTQADLRIVLDASNTAQLLPIVVQDAAGNTDATKNARLQAFMTAKNGRVFYNDVPQAGKDQVLACATANSYCKFDSYSPAFANNNKVYPCAQSDLYAGLLPNFNCANQVTFETLSAGGITARRGGFYNNREQKWVRMLNVNIRDLLAWNMAQTAANRLFDPADATDGGLVIFLTVKGPNTSTISNPRYGVRVFGSPYLDFPVLADPTGVTVVSDQAMYVEGNYNQGDATHPWQPAALIGDTVNILSSAWSSSTVCRNDCQSRQTLASRPGASTTINAAFISGVDVTTSGNYNGGLENYPRFQEDWSPGAATLTYRGSFVSLGAPLHNNGAWCGTGGSSTAGCNIYNPPVRNWNYDSQFQNVANLPPLTPRFVSVQQIIFTENFR